MCGTVPGFRRSDFTKTKLRSQGPLLEALLVVPKVHCWNLPARRRDQDKVAFPKSTFGSSLSNAAEAPNIHADSAYVNKGKTKLPSFGNLPAHSSSDSHGQQHHTSSSPSRRRVPFFRTRLSCSPPRPPRRPCAPTRRTGLAATSSSCRRSARTCRGTRSGCLLLACGRSVSKRFGVCVSMFALASVVLIDSTSVPESRGEC